MLELCFVVLFDRMSDNLWILYFHDDIIVNINNDITYNGESCEFLTEILDMSFNELSRMLRDWLDWNIFKIKVEITWSTLSVFK